MSADLLLAEPSISKRQWLLAATAGALTPFCFAPFNQGWLMPCLLAVLLWLQYGKSPAQAFKLGLVFGVPGFIGGLHWIYISTHVYSGAPLALSIFLIVLLALYLSLFGALASLIAAWFGRQPGNAPNLGYWLLSYVLAWPLLELLRNTILTGFPWFALGYTQTDTVLSGLAPFVGVFGLAIPVLLLAAIPVGFKQGRVFVVALLVLLLLLLGYAGQRLEWTQAQGDPMQVGIAQGNIEQDQKWLPEQLWPTVTRYRQLTETLLADADLIVWPEVAVPGVYREFHRSLFVPLAEQLKANQSELLAGIMRWDDASGQYANSVVHIGAGAPRFYDKQHLVPFAEYFPVPDFVRAWLQSLELPFTDLYTGDKYRSAFQVGEHKVAVSICFEDVFAEEVALAAAEASILVNVSNDAWFGDSIAAAQHEQIARMRSIETQRWMVRATPTGWSAFIDPAGEVVQRLPRAELATAVQQLQPRIGNTPYMQYRNYWMLGLLVVLLVLLWLKRRQQRLRAFNV
jgi:apolipoprotein N-acyltransferase